MQAKIAARKGDPETIDLMVSVLKQRVDGLDNQGRTLLFYAVRGTRDDDGNLQQAGGSIAGPRTENFAPGCSQGAAAQHLVQIHGFNVNFQTHSSGMTPLMEAARYGNIACATQLLLLGADCKLRNAKGHSAGDIARLSVPNYLELSEAMCSETNWDAVKARINSDRMKVAALLETVEKNGLEAISGTRSQQNSNPSPAA